MCFIFMLIFITYIHIVLVITKAFLFDEHKHGFSIVTISPPLSRALCGDLYPISRDDGKKDDELGTLG